jgi:UDP-glucose 4-epimerase
MYHLLLQSSGAINAVVMNMTNIYGPRMALNIPCQGVLSAFVRRCLLGERLEVYGDGSQLRDPLHVDDAVEALVAVGAASRLCSHLYSLGGPEPLRLLQIAAIAAGTTGGEKPVCIAFPLERKLIDIGSTYSSSKSIGKELGWKPKVCFPEGFSSTINFYRSRMEHYLSGTPHCPLCDRRGEEAQASVNGGFPARTSAAVSALALLE